jgi:hypothetical protein
VLGFAGQARLELAQLIQHRVTAALDERIGHAQAVAAPLLREDRHSRVVEGGEGR